MKERCILGLQDLVLADGGIRDRIAQAWGEQIGPLHPDDFPRELRGGFEQLGDDLGGNHPEQEHDSVRATLQGMTDEEVHEIGKRLVRLACEALHSPDA